MAGFGAIRYRSRSSVRRRPWGGYGEVYSVAVFSITSFPGDYSRQVKFKLSDGTPNFLVVSPSSGTTPSEILVGPNPNVTRRMQPGRYRVGVTFTTVDQSPAVTTVAIVTLTLSQAAPPKIDSVVNAASLQPVVSP